MLADETKRQSKKRQYTVIFIPDNESKSTRTFSFGIFRLMGIVLFSIVLIVAFVLILLIYTQLGNLLPIKNTELENRYSNQVINIQRQLNGIMREMVVLRAYNLRLRKALGEQISSSESLNVMTYFSDTVDFMGQLEKEDLLPETKGAVDQSTLLSQRTDEIRSLKVERTFGSWNADIFPLSLPVAGYLVRGFNVEQNHFGIDIAAKEGSPVTAAADGVVIFADWTYDDGFKVIIAHPQGYLTVYKHNKDLIKSVGIRVKRGDIIAFLGSTGRTSSGPHLHFEVWKDGVVVDPALYLLAIN